MYGIPYHGGRFNAKFHDEKDKENTRLKQEVSKLADKLTTERREAHRETTQLRDDNLRQLKSHIEREQERNRKREEDLIRVSETNAIAQANALQCSIRADDALVETFERTQECIVLNEHAAVQRHKSIERNIFDNANDTASQLAELKKAISRVTTLLHRMEESSRERYQLIGHRLDVISSDIKELWTRINHQPGFVKMRTQIIESQIQKDKSMQGEITMSINADRAPRFVGDSSNKNPSVRPSANRTSKPCVVMLDNIPVVNELRDLVSKDEEALQKLFGSEIADVKKPVQGQSIITSAVECQKEDYSAYSSVIVFFFCGGSGMLLRDGNNIQVEDLLRPFFKNRTLRRKPKLFFVQAIGRQSKQETTNSKLSKHNYLLCNCEMPESAYRRKHTSEGCVFTRKLQEAMSRHSKNDIATVLDDVHESISREAYSGVVFNVYNNLQSPVRI